MSRNTLYSALKYDPSPSKPIEPFTKPFFRGFHISKSVYKAGTAILFSRHPSYEDLEANKVLPTLKKALPAVLPPRLAGEETPESIREYDGILFPTYKKDTVFSEGCDLPDVKPPSQTEFDAAPAMDSARRKRKILPSDDESSDDDSVHDSSKPPLKKKTKADVVKNPPKELETVSDDEIPSVSTSKGPHKLRKTGAKYPQESDDEDDGKSKRTAKNKNTQSIRAVSLLSCLILKPRSSSSPLPRAASSPFMVLERAISSFRSCSSRETRITSLVHRWAGFYLGRPSGSPPRLYQPCDLGLRALLRFKADCIPNGLGVECVHCSIKKVGHLCDHAANAGRLHNLVQSLKDLTEIMDPSIGSLDLPFLKRLGERALTMQTLAQADQKEFGDCLRKFLEAVGGQNSILGSAGLESLFPKDVAPHVRPSFNQLILAFNEAMGSKGSDVKSEVSEGSSLGSDDVIMAPAGPSSESGLKPTEDAAENK
ncbi:hypothetical protein B0H13DRAFT_1926278 [Mycena leptocephala]|nr:hypothetical protein B0H13DRAFT_1926278 [Mycena leptocephala]